VVFSPIGAQSAVDEAKASRNSQMQCANLSDDELWRGISQNTEAMSDLIHQMYALKTGSKAGARTNRVANTQTINALERQYQIYTAELRRRYP
jgi:hypothetical protein